MCDAPAAKKMNILKHVKIDCESYADVARRHGVVVEQVCEMDNVDHERETRVGILRE